jgi:hypothetical protein
MRCMCLDSRIVYAGMGLNGMSAIGDAGHRRCVSLGNAPQSRRHSYVKAYLPLKTPTPHDAGMETWDQCRGCYVKGRQWQKTGRGRGCW